MKTYLTPRNFIRTDLEREDDPRIPDTIALVQESSAIGDYPDSMENPGSSFLWIGGVLHLNREHAADLARRINHWLDTGRLPLDPEPIP